MNNIAQNKLNISAELKTDSTRTAIANFGVRLFCGSLDSEENALISPLSVVSSLAMCQNGAGGSTLEQMSDVLGVKKDALNQYMAAYLSALPDTEKSTLRLANSVWFTNDTRFTVNKDFLQTNADFYGADIYKAPFDSSTVGEINHWVSDKTDGMIKKVISEIPSSAVMYLINALTFDAEWQSIYEKKDIKKRNFTKEDGTVQDVNLMYSTEGWYIKDENAVGFIKYYSKSKYAFVALLPDENVTVSDYASSLNGEKLLSLIENAEHATVNAAIPEFDYKYSSELAETLANMGMEDAFDADTADFTALGSSTAGNIFISRVIHKTYIEVGARGTKAGAATVIEMADGAADLIENPKEVILDRPFMFTIIDCETNLPVFIGALRDVN